MPINRAKVAAAAGFANAAMIAAAGSTVARGMNSEYNLSEERKKKGEAVSTIKKGDPVFPPEASEPLVASRDEYNSRVWVMTEREYQLQNSPHGPRGKEEPYLILPDRKLVRDYQHGFPD